MALEHERFQQEQETTIFRLMEEEGMSPADVRLDVLSVDSLVNLVRRDNNNWFEARERGQHAEAAQYARNVDVYLGALAQKYKQ